MDALQDMGPELLASLKGNVYLQRRPKPGQGCVDEPVGRSKSSATLNDKLASLLRKSCSPSDLESVYIAEVMAPSSYVVWTPGCLLWLASPQATPKMALPVDGVSTGQQCALLAPFWFDLGLFGR